MLAAPLRMKERGKEDGGARRSQQCGTLPPTRSSGRVNAASLPLPCFNGTDAL